tara:strand:- start:176 stop:382 length:207 start_codon:yes stop_codon:yes gene_type:complete
MKYNPKKSESHDYLGEALDRVKGIYQNLKDSYLGSFNPYQHSKRKLEYDGNSEQEKIKELFKLNFEYV